MATQRKTGWRAMLAAGTLATGAALGLVVPQATAQEKVLRAVMHADVRTLDPHWTTQTIAGIHGLLVYDMLFGVDNDFVPQPQMVDRYEISQDKLTYTMTLRDGLAFHDGSPVTTRDVIASLRRWGARDPAGQRLLQFTDRMEADDARTFRIVLKEPYGQVLATLGKTSTSVPLIMREKEALVDPNTQVTEAIGSGPFRFAKEQWVPGSKTVYLKNAAYVPRKEPAQTLAGGKIPGVDRVELIWMPDPQTAMQALVNGEIDFLEQPSIDFIPILEKSRGVALMKTGKIDSHFGMIRLNHLHAPFNNIKIRQAMYKLINQEDFLRTVVGNPQYYKVCHGLITCGSPLENKGGSALLAGYDPKGAAAAFKAAGYNGEPITILHATDHHTINPITQVMIQAMREAGLNLDIQAMDWGSVVQRRAKKEPPAQGGWHIFVTTSSGTSGANPIIHTWIGAACDRGLFGWPCDDQVEKLRSAWGFAQTDAERLRIATELQTRAIENVVYIPTGQWTQPLAYRSDRLSGIVPITGITALWNITKK